MRGLVGSLVARRRNSKRKEATRAKKRVMGVHLDWLEIALGYDQWGRGDPDPVVLVAVYRQRRLLRRELVRPRVPSPYPASVEHQRLFEVEVGRGRVGVLVVAYEEDSGKDVAELYARLEAGDIELWSTAHEEPSPRSLATWIRAASTGDEAVELLVEGNSLADGARDDYVGACMIVCGDDGSERTKRRSHRLHMRSRDGKNDWTMQVTLTG